MSLKIGDSISRPDFIDDDMPTPSSAPESPPKEKTKVSGRLGLIAAAALIGLAIGGLALVDRLREHPTRLGPSHEPSQTLTTPLEPLSSLPNANADQPISPPSPPKVINNAKLAAPPSESVATPIAPAAPDNGRAAKPASTPVMAYMVQVGVFATPANAQALQKQLRRAGIEAHLETRVRIGPFKDKLKADKAMMRAKKLGIHAILVRSR